MRRPRGINTFFFGGGSVTLIVTEEWLRSSHGARVLWCCYAIAACQQQQLVLGWRRSYSSRARMNSTSLIGGFAGMLGREMLKIMVVAGLAADLTQIPDDAVPYGNEFAEHLSPSLITC